MFRRPLKEGTSTCVAVSAHVNNTTAKWRDVAKQLLGQLRNVAEENGADVLAGDFNNVAAYRERGQVGMSHIEGVWEAAVLCLPPNRVQMWDHMEEMAVCWWGLRIAYRRNQAGDAHRRVRELSKCDSQAL